MYKYSREFSSNGRRRVTNRRCIWPNRTWSILPPTSFRRGITVLFECCPLLISGPSSKWHWVIWWIPPLAPLARILLRLSLVVWAPTFMNLLGSHPAIILRVNWPRHTQTLLRRWHRRKRESRRLNIPSRREEHGVANLCRVGHMRAWYHNVHGLPCLPVAPSYSSVRERLLVITLRLLEDPVIIHLMRW